MAAHAFLIYARTRTREFERNILELTETAGRGLQAVLYSGLRVSVHSKTRAQLHWSVRAEGVLKPSFVRGRVGLAREVPSFSAEAREVL